MSTPILASRLATKLGAKYILAVNMLDSYKDRSLDDYIKLLRKYQIEPDEYWIDSENIQILLDRIYYLIEKGFIHNEKRLIMSCDCNKVEIPVSNINTINMADSCFYQKEGEYYCKHCGSVCKEKEVDSLVFNPQKITNSEYIFFPEFLNKDIKTFYNTILNNYIIISRKRETGVNIIYQNKEYNIDIDFLWGTYLSLFPNKEKVVICSNHQLYQLFMVSMLEKCFNSPGKTIALATPYLNIIQKEKEKELEDRVLSTIIFSILNQKWAKKENSLDPGLLTYINSMNVVKKEQLYSILMEQNVTVDFFGDLKKTLIHDFNVQNANKKLKRRRENV